MDLKGFHAVSPKTDCPHCSTDNILELTHILSMGKKISDTCQTCSVNGEVWLCLKCAEIHCSRYVEGHMAKHYSENPDHMLAFSFADFSFWCYACDSYVIHQLLNHQTNQSPDGFYIQKFGQPGSLDPKAVLDKIRSSKNQNQVIEENEDED